MLLNQLSKQYGKQEIMLESVPGYAFYKEMYYFIKNPEILDGEWESTPLKYSFKNLVNSILLVTSVLITLDWILKGFDILEFPSVINPVLLSINLLVQALIFGLIFWASASFVTCFRRVGAHKLYFYQVIQAYALLNFISLILFWFALNRVMVTGSASISINKNELWFGGILGTAALVLAWWLLVIPTANYLSRYYSRFGAWVLTLIVLTVTLSINSKVNFGFGQHLLNKSEFCEQIYKIRNQRESVSDTEKSCFIGKCIKGLSE
ncbi:hypothetical protein [Ferrimonas balearica]|uniref:hypothetical protein n=1 Tax=Ferrimonas balearica TaxID=44012 RepID=UPI001C9908B2|nr:hypothetical protein [Ferrimonas balearica]MBY5920141.1 hypothetical protein [Ferrimonas balearica]MBY5997174.1 hypothetical protein [Ferrimonas balearica]